MLYLQTSYGQGSENRSRKFGRQTSAMACSDHKVYIVWLESFDDCYTFPESEYFNLILTVHGEVMVMVFELIHVFLLIRKVFLPITILNRSIL